MTRDPGPGPDDRAATEFHEFYLKYDEELHEYVRSRWPHFDTESIVNQTFELAWTNWYKIHGVRIAWAKSVAHRLAIDIYRANREILLGPTEMAALIANSGVVSEEDLAITQQLEEALRDLPPRLEKAMRMSLGGFSKEDIAKEMNCKVASVIQYRSQARELIAKRSGLRFRRRGRHAREDPVSTNRKPGHHQDEED